MRQEHHNSIQADNKMAVIIEGGIIAIVPTIHSVVHGLVMNILVANASKKREIVFCTRVQRSEHHSGIIVIFENIAGDAVFVNVGINVPQRNSKKQFQVKRTQKMPVVKP